jgi:tetratricopeptide (TPR) repeat protein
MHDLARDYQELLVSEPSLQGVDRAIALVRKLVDVKLPWDHDAATAEGKLRRRVGEVADALRLLRHANVHKLPLGNAGYSLLVDAEMVLFHQSYFALLPQLEERAEERDALLDAFHAFANEVPRLPDRFKVLSLTFEAEGKADKALECLRYVLQSTHSDDPEFMTTLQSVWSELVDQQNYREAMVLLMDNYPRVTLEDLDEMRQLVMTTFDLSAKGSPS